MHFLPYKIVFNVFLSIYFLHQTLTPAEEHPLNFEEVRGRIRDAKARIESAQAAQNSEELMENIGKEIQLAIWGGSKGHTSEIYHDLLKYVVHLFGKYRLISLENSFERNNILHVTVAFTVQSGFYDHACLLCDGIMRKRDGSLRNPSPILYFDLSLKEGSTKSGVAVKSGISSVDYKVKCHDVEYVVENFLLRAPLTKGVAHDLVQFYPYKTFHIRSTERIHEGLDYLDEQVQATSASYSIRANNCITFIAKVLHRFGVFKETYDERSILKYSAKGRYPCHGGLPFVYDGIVRPFSHSPEWLKELIDDNNITKIEGSCYSAALDSSRGPAHSERSGRNLVELDDVLRNNLGEIFLREAEENYIPRREEEVRDSASISIDFNEQKKSTCTVS